MYQLLVFLLHAVSAEAVAVANISSKLYDSECTEEAFAQFQQEYRKTSGHNATARRMRLCEIIAENTKHNAGNASFSRRINEMGDFTPEEYAARLGFIPTPTSSRRKREWGVNDFSLGSSSESASAEVPDTVDWRTSGYVTAVKNQGSCGGCWAFSATGSLEGQLAKKGSQLTSLSEQNLIDCSRENLGCDGGNTALAFEYVKRNAGVDTETGYPYQAKQGRCKYSATDRGGEDSGYVAIATGDENALKTAVATIGPISVAIDASLNSFAYYASGVYYDASCSSSNLDHAILVVGYGTDETHGDYWLIKNSWGMSWGEEGYGKMARNRGNACGIATEAVYPRV